MNHPKLPTVAELAEAEAHRVKIRAATVRLKRASEDRTLPDLRKLTDTLRALVNGPHPLTLQDAQATYDRAWREA